MSFLTAVTLFAFLLHQAAAQTWTSCNPLNQTDCPPDVALGTNYTWDFASANAGSTWNTTAGTIVYGDQGAEFTIANPGDSPTIQSNFYIFFGEVEVWIKAATGRGVVSSSVLQSDDLDEIDWEFIGSNQTFGETNYYGKGNTTDAYLRSKWHPTTNTTADFHNYTVRWTAESINWYIDGNMTRTLNYADANGGASYPQTPMNVRIGIWPAGDPKNNNYTIEWAGGKINYDEGPYTMYVKSVRVTDFSTGSEYKYGNESGTWQSIDIVPGNSTVAKTLSAPPPQSVSQRFNGLPTGTKIAIGASIGGVFLIALAAFFFYAARQRKAGRLERQAEDAAYERDTAELLQFRSVMGAKQWERL